MTSTDFTLSVQATVRNGYVGLQFSPHLVVEVCEDRPVDEVAADISSHVAQLVSDAIKGAVAGGAQPEAPVSIVARPY